MGRCVVLVFLLTSWLCLSDHVVSDESLSTTSKAAEKVVEKKLPLPGELFQVEVHASFLIPASQLHPQGGRPWVWYAPTLPNLPGMAE